MAALPVISQAAPVLRPGPSTTSLPPVQDAANEPILDRALRGADAASPGESASWPRLALAVTASVMMHLAAAMALSVSAPYPVIRNASPKLSVHLAQVAHSMPSTPPSVQAAAETAAAARHGTTATPKTAARFLADPDLSILETIAVSLPGSISLKLKVSAQGQVEDVTVVRSDPAPKELVDGLMRAFAQARLAPAMVGDAPTASSLEVTIRFEPGLVPLDPAQRQ